MIPLGELERVVRLADEFVALPTPLAYRTLAEREEWLVRRGRYLEARAALAPFVASPPDPPTEEQP